MNPSTIAELERWFVEQCDGDWEHRAGITIESLDNPGWSVAINIEDTPVEDRAFETVNQLESEDEWLIAEVKDGYFTAHGGPRMLEKMLRLFLDWAR